MKDKKYTDQDYHDAMMFALNYPREIDIVRYDIPKDLWLVRVFDYGWYSPIRLNGDFVRSCLKWKGKKAWRKEEPVDYEKLFGQKSKADE